MEIFVLEADVGQWRSDRLMNAAPDHVRQRRKLHNLAAGASQTQIEWGIVPGLTMTRQLHSTNSQRPL